MKNLKEHFLKTLDIALKLKEKPLTSALPPHKLIESFDICLEENPSVESAIDTIEKIISYSVNTQNPRFLNQLNGGSTQESWLGELLVSILNTSMATFEIAPLATLMEKEIISQLGKKIGFDHCEGLMAPGGSYANMLGLHCARQFYNPSIKKQGNNKQFHIYVSEDAHYSSEKALNLMGMGTKSLIKVKTDETHKMSLSELKKAIEASKRSHITPLCVVSTAGTTVWGAFDPLEGISEICQKEGLWHHVDAAWGGLAIWSEKAPSLFKGLHLAQSIALDFHKLMASSLTKGMFITSKKGILQQANSGGGGEYIFHNHDDKDKASFDTGTYALQCGRRVNSLPVWLQWKLNGAEGYKKQAHKMFTLAKFTQNFIQKSPEKYKLLLEPEYMNICFQVLPTQSSMPLGEFNSRMREELLSRGHFMVNYAKDKQHGAFFRLVLSQWGLTEDIIKELFAELELIKNKLDKT